MVEFKRKPARPKGISDSWVINPPSDCHMRKFVLRGTRVQDIVICAFKCINPCDVYYEHEREIAKTKKKLKKDQQKKGDKNDTTEVQALGQTYRRRR